MNIGAESIKKITVEQFLKSKVHDRAMMRSALDIGTFEFMVSATQHAKKRFQDSFKEAGFYKQKKWEKRSKPYSHPLLDETGGLKNIKDKKVKKTQKTKQNSIYTTEKRGNRINKKNIGYGAVHNDPLPSYTVNQYSSKPPIKRQFMGHNDAIYKEITDKFEGKIFNKLINTIETYE